MTACKACNIALRWLSLESEVGGKPVVAEETYAVAGSIGYGCIGEKQTETIDAIVDERADCSRYNKTEHTPEVFLPASPELFDAYCHVDGTLIEYLTDVIERSLLHLFVYLGNVNSHSPD